MVPFRFSVIVSNFSEMFTFLYHLQQYTATVVAFYYSGQ